MTDTEDLKIPDWLPLKEREETLLEACSHEDVELHEDKQRETRVFLFSRKLIEAAGVTEKYIQTYRATNKGINALRISKVMKRLGIGRPTRQIIRFPDSDLSDLLAKLKEIDAKMR